MFVTCQLHVLSGRSQGDPAGGMPPASSPRNFAAVDYFDSRRSVIDAIPPSESPLVTALGMIFGLVADHGAEIAEVDVRGPHDVRFALKLPVPDSVMAEPSQ